MPELPEVETVKKELKNEILNLKIIDFNLVVNKSLRNEFDIKKIKNERIVNVHRKGKQLVIETDKYWLGVHLRMEGKLFYDNELNNLKHSIFWCKLDKGYLIFTDHRKFATLDIYNKADNLDWKVLPIFNKINEEPFYIDKNVFYKDINKRTKNIKSILLDQSIVSGIGNIYANEILYRSNISPLRKGKEITRKESDLIIEVSKDVLNDSIRMGGSTISTYQSSKGKTGQFQNKLTVHKKKHCPKGHELIFEKIGGRGTYWCNKEQK